MNAAIINKKQYITGRIIERAIRTGVASTSEYDLIDVENTYLFGLIWRNQLYMSPLAGKQVTIGRLNSRKNKIKAVSVEDEGEDLLSKRARKHVYPHRFTYILKPNDRFIIVASYEFWKHVSPKVAVKMVQKNSRFGIAKTLIRYALKRCLHRSYLKYSVLLKMTGDVRSKYHDIMNVIVIYFDNQVHVKNNSFNSVCVRSNETGVISTVVSEEDELFIASIGNIAQGEND